MSTSRIGFSFSINNFPIKKDFDTRINIREDFNPAQIAKSYEKGGAACL